MKCRQLELYRYSLPLARPLTLAGKTQSHKSGILVKLIGDNGFCGYGDVSPLPGFSQETLNEAELQLAKAGDTILLQLPSHPERLDGCMDRWLSPFKFVSSVRCGLEMALLNLTAAKKNDTVSHLLSKSKHQTVPVAGLLDGPTDDMLKEARTLVDSGFKALKLKTGKTELKEDIKRIKKVGEIASDKTLLRLDANRKWDINQAVELGNEIGCAAVEYIEEPFGDHGKIEEFYMKTTIPVALDESLPKLTIKDVNALPGVDVLILKPTMLGGIEKAWQWMDQAHHLGIRTTVSSSYESGIGISFYANLAACPHLPNPVGLDTLKYFKNDVLQEPLSVTRGHMPVMHPAGERQLDSAVLEKIA